MGLAVQLPSTATLASNTDLIRPAKAWDLRQRLASTVVRLVHTEEITDRGTSDVQYLRAVSPYVSWRLMWSFSGIF